ncbi:hypothetical protein K1719_026886 [Acacia pycnantha]|nr:hypothetical protein K1719_026886 [Acacia pycnantha]
MEVSWNSQYSKFLFTAVYGSPQAQYRKYLWQDVSLLNSNLSSPWLLAGDFNAILNHDERQGGSTHRADGCSLFNNFVNSNGLMDMGSQGPKFTWRRGSLFMRLDWAICNPQWLHSFPSCEVTHLAKIKLDHRPIHISLGSGSKASHFYTPFKFLAPWISHPDFSSIVKRVWSSEESLIQRIDSFVKEIQIWNSKVFGGIGQPSLTDELEDVCFQEELLWLQKSSSEWLCLGDRNTGYYHLKALMKRKRNKVNRLKSVDGTWVEVEDDLANLARDFFKDLYSLTDTTFHPLSLQGAFPKIADEHLLAMEREVTLDELKSSLFEMKPLKAPDSVEWETL